MLHKAVKEFSNIKIVHHNLPFDKECNFYISINVHPYACFMSKAALAAKKQGNYWEMSSLLYENHPKNMDELLKFVEELGFDKEIFIKDFGSEALLMELQQEIKAAEDLDIDATPTMIINGEKVVGVKPYYQLKEILVKNGAKKR